MNIFIENGNFLFVDGEVEWSSSDSGWFFNEEDILLDLNFGFSDNYIDNEDYDEYNCYIDNFSANIIRIVGDEHLIFHELFSSDKIKKYL